MATNFKIGDIVRLKSGGPNNATVGLNTLVYKQLTFDPLKDLAPVTMLAESQTLLVVHPSGPAKTVPELVALAKANPGALNFGSTGTGPALNPS